MMRIFSSNQVNRPAPQRGFSLIEILIAIVIFAVGMLALVQLQGGLSRSSADGAARTVAANLAEAVFETGRSFGRLTTDPGGNVLAYADIKNAQKSVVRGGAVFIVDTTVTDYYYTGSTFSTTNSQGSSVSDFKLVTVDVTWNANQKFQVAAGTEMDLGSGALSMSNMISSVTSAGTAKATVAGGDNLYNPDVDYTPGTRPDVISIALGNNKFKESTVPLPDIYRVDELVETTFDVVTYSQHENGATFLRREEFRAVSCACSLQASSGSIESGLRPTVWNGVDYTEGDGVAKTSGVTDVNHNQQSIYCDICCRDHHDGGNGGNVAGDPGRSEYDPFKSSSEYFSTGTFSGDHKHYARNNAGVLELADSNGEAYEESCRLVRKDGFFRVAQDLRMEAVNNFTEGYLETDAGVSVYSGYVTGAISGYESDVGATNEYETSPPVLIEASAMSPPIVFPASNPAVPAIMPDPYTAATSQQMQSRGVYIDYLSDEVRTIVNCMDLGGTGEACGGPDATNALEVIPFFDVQLTWLARWQEEPTDQPISVSNEPIENANAHNRGLAAMTLGFGLPRIFTTIHPGNLSLTGTDPIDQLYLSRVKSRNSYILAMDPSSPVPTGNINITGTITSSVGGVKAADVTIYPTGAICDRTLTGFECVLEIESQNPRLKVSNYQKANKYLVACSPDMDINGSENGANNWTRFNLPEEDTFGVSIVIKENSC